MIVKQKNSSDEYFTPDYAVKPILKYIKENDIVWCPFDKSDSAFVKLISKKNQVVFSHIEDNKDFFTYQPKKFDVIISNPPFKGKRFIFERALSFNKPFALIMTNAWLNDSYSKKVFINKKKQMQLLFFDKRIKFLNNENKQNNKITFSSSYFCYDFLPKDIILEILKIK